MKQLTQPLVLIILDGWGMSDDRTSNSITLAKIQHFTSLWKTFPHARLYASGEHVGLLAGQEGNSEAGHLNIGAGRLVLQDVRRINQSIEDGTFFRNPAFEQAVKNVLTKHSHLHLMGLLSAEDSGHANPRHVQALLEFCRARKVPRLFLHLFTDGRDTPRYSSAMLMEQFVKTLRRNECVVTVMGRLYGMDRKKNWEHTQRAYNALVLGEGYCSPNPARSIRDAYLRGESDEFIQPTVISRGEDGRRLGRIENHDSVIFFNLRSDRARQLTKPFTQEQFTLLNPGSFERKKTLYGLTFVGMTDFGPDLSDMLIAYPYPELANTLPAVLSSFRQLYIAESEKYAHVSYFLNGGHANPVGGEERVMVPSPAVEHYDQTPAMATREITEVILQNVKHQVYDVVVANFAAPDMIGHTGNLKAGMQAVGVVDECIGRVFDVMQQCRGTLILTADHGNIEQMVSPKTGEVVTEHSTNMVPFLVADTVAAVPWRLKKTGVLADVAPTILDLLSIPQPIEMTGKSLILHSKPKV